MDVQTLEKTSIDRVAGEIANVAETVKIRIQNAFLSALDNNVTPKIGLLVRSLNASSGRNAASATTNLELGEQVGITASFENVSHRRNTFHEFNVNDETRE